MAEEKSRRASKLTFQQKNMLTDFLTNHPQLVAGTFSQSFTFKDAQTQWQELTTSLNSVPGAKKDWRQWKKAWQDLKKNTKQKNANLKRYALGTGGGPSSKDSLTPTEHGILEIIGSTAVEGHAGIRESTAIIDQLMEVHAEEMQPAEQQPEAQQLVTQQPEAQQLEAQQLNMDQELKYAPVIIIDEQPHTPSTVNDGPVQKCTTPATFKRKRIEKKRVVVAHRLTRTISATEQLANLSEKKLEEKKKYYDKKLEIMQQQLQLQHQQLNLQQRQLEVSESIAHSLSKIIEDIR